MDERRALYRLARLCGIETSWRDIEGRVHRGAPEAVCAVLGALGCDVARPADAPEALRRRLDALGRRLVEPVNVLWQGEPPRLRLGRGVRPELPSLEVALTLEDGGTRVARCPVLSVSRRRRALSLEPLGPLPPGRHRLELPGVGSPPPRAVLIVAPRCSWQPLEPLAHGTAVLVPAWAPHTEAGEPVGHLGLLERIARRLGEAGVQALATLPLYAQLLDPPSDPSPYAPASRLLWNELYLDLAAVPEFAGSAPPREAAGTHVASRVDYEASWRVVRAALTAGRARLERGASERRAGFERFVARSPLVRDYARFRALREHAGPDPERWPVHEAALAGAVREAEQAFLYGQWLCAQQLPALRDRLARRGLALYLDLPLGVHGRGFDPWRFPALFARGVSAGAPPDPFSPSGQRWGLPPIAPHASRADGHAYVSRCLEHVMALAGVLRIDHVMSLWRLFWIPDGLPASEGLYVRYPHEEWLALVCLLSQRHRCAVVGEDLGTVPDAVRRGMQRHALARSYVVPFALPEHGDPPPPPPGSVASLETHDLPPFASWWCEGGDDDAARRRRERWCSVLRREGLLVGGQEDELDAVWRASLRWLALSRAALVQFTLEALWHEREPINVPAHPEREDNWRRRLRYRVEQIERLEALSRFLPALDGAREAVRTVESSPTQPVPLEQLRLGSEDIEQLRRGTHRRLWERFGALWARDETGRVGVLFRVWAPRAASVHVIGEHNGWRHDRDPLQRIGDSGCWERFCPEVRPGMLYKFHVVGAGGRGRFDKADPFARWSERPPATASRVHAARYRWRDEAWLERRAPANDASAPISIYEVHLGSWRRVPQENNRPLGYREIAPRLAAYASAMGFSHVELLPLAEHPFYGSWGYQATGYYAPTARYGPPEDLMFLVDTLHRAGLGVILDWVPSHFASDAHALARFDGEPLYEHPDPRRGWHPDWNSCVFDYGRPEVRAFLISNALYWIERFHVDGLRLDAVASMLYLDYSRGPGQWEPNIHGGNENLEAISLLRELNDAIAERWPAVRTWAEESTAWPGVTHATEHGGLGFGYKWDMGWMHDTLRYFTEAPEHRPRWHESLTFRALYAHAERFCLPLSHDEVVHGKGSLYGRMPGGHGDKLANLRLLFAYQWTTPGKKLLFMGGEWGQRREWNHDASLDWHLLDDPGHRGLQRWVRALNHRLRTEAALHERDHDPGGFAWLDCHAAALAVLSYVRFGREGARPVVVLLNLANEPRPHWRTGLPVGGRWQRLLCSDDPAFGGGGRCPPPVLHAEPFPWQHQRFSAVLTLPPLTAIVLAPAEDRG